MRLRFARAIVPILLVTCFVCPLVEIFDHWDNTLQTGNDSEYALVIVVLCVGAAYSLAHFIFKRPDIRYASKFTSRASVQVAFFSTQFSFNLLLNAISPPPLELRV